MIYETIPEIKRSSMNSVVLYLKVLGIHNVIDFDYFERPSDDQITEVSTVNFIQLRCFSIALFLQALMTLYLLGALDKQGQVTDIGVKMAAFPLEPFLARMIVESNLTSLSSTNELLTIVSMASTENLFMSKTIIRTKKKPVGAPASSSSKLSIRASVPYSQHFQQSNNNDMDEPNEDELRNERIDRAHTKLRHPRGDYWTYLKIYLEWEKCGFSPEWCSEQYLHYRSLKMARNIKEQLQFDCKKASVNMSVQNVRTEEVFDPKNESRVGMAIAAALYMNAARYFLYVLE